MEGQRVGAYRVGREIGSGGMGRVYAAVAEKAGRSLAPGDPVAVKVVHPHLLESAEALARFRREVEIGASVRHPNVVRTFGGGREGDTHYLVMELVEGQTLRELLDELGRVPEELCCHVGAEIARGLAAIHATGAIHRDVKPENVLITGEHAVKIMDLGVARLADEALRLSRTGAFVGSIQYAAPECFGGGEPPDHRVDLHALGLVLYELATGDAPYAAPDVHSAIRRVLDERPRRLGELAPQVSPFLEDVVHTLLVKEPRGRFASAEEVGHVLDEGESGAWWQARARALRVETRRPLRRIRIPRDTEIHGRESELDQLLAAFERATRSDGQVVLIEGEAGIGKSRLVDEMILRLERSGAAVDFLHGEYPPGGAATVSGAFSSAYREHLGVEGSAAYLRETPLLVPAFDALLRGDAVPAGAQPLSKGALQTCFVHVTRALARERSVVVLIDDLHFAPEEGRALFSALAMAVPGHRVLLIGTARRGMPKEWVTGVTRLGHARQITLDRLGPKDLYALLRDALRSERLADRLAGRIGRKSDGNPFFVFEILRGLRESGMITRADDGSWVSTEEIEEIRIPSSVLDLVEARVAELSDEEHELLEVAACCGFEFDGTLVAAALGEPRIPVLRRLGRLEKRLRLVRARGRLHVFDHHQVREVLYDRTSEVLREEYHRALADALEAREGAADRDPDDLDGGLSVQLCEHLFAGGEPRRARRYLSAATRHLSASHVHDHAVTLADRALEEPGLVEGIERSRLLRRKAVWLSHYGRAEEERRALEDALEIATGSDDVEEQVRCRVAYGKHLRHVADREGALRELRAALALAEAHEGRRLLGSALNELATALYFHGRFAEARELFRRQLAVADDLGDPHLRAMGRSNLGLVHLAEMRLDEARELFGQALAIATESGDRRGQGVAVSNLGGIAYHLGRWEEARAAFEQDLALSREVGDRRAETAVTGNLGIAVRALGHYADARALHSRFMDLAEELGDRRAAASARGMLGTLHVLVGDHEGAAAWIEASIASAGDIGDRRSTAWALRREGDLHLSAGDVRRALRSFEEVAEIARNVGLRGLLAEALSQTGAALRLLGDAEAARAPLAEAAGLATEIGIPGWIVLTALRRARSGDLDPAEAAALLDLHSDRMEVSMHLHARFLAWRLSDDTAHLERARELLDVLRAHTPEAHRGSLVDAVPVNRAVRDGDASAAVE